MEVSTLQIGDRQIPYTIKEHPDSKYVQLKLRPNLELEIFAPRVSDADVKAVLKKKRNWIKAKYDEIVNSRRIFDGKRLLYKGRPHEVEFVRSSNPAVQLKNRRIAFQIDGSSDPESELKDWMKTETEKLVKERLIHFSKKLRMPFNGFSVQETKKWAYGTMNRRLVFNWQLVALPKKLSDYVIIHELTHIGEFSHSKRFRYLL